MQDSHVLQGKVTESRTKQLNDRRKTYRNFFLETIASRNERVLMVLEIFLSDPKEVAINNIHTDEETRYSC